MLRPSDSSGCSKKTPAAGAKVGAKKLGGGEAHAAPICPRPPLKSVPSIVGTSSALEGMRDKSQPRGAVKSQGAAAVGG